VTFEMTFKSWMAATHIFWLTYEQSMSQEFVVWIWTLSIGRTSECW